MHGPQTRAAGRAAFAPIAAAMLMSTTAILRAGPVSHLAGDSRNGQVFLTWDEADTEPGTTFNVYLHRRAIDAATISEARRIGHHVEPHSARDWWQDPASFAQEDKPAQPVGFRIAPDRPPLDPRGGLFVHTVIEADPEAGFFAVTHTPPDGKEKRSLTAGDNSLATPVSMEVAPIEAIWLGQDPAPQAGSAAGKPLIFSLHGRGGGKTVGKGAATVNYLMFGDASHGWREGLAVKFRAQVSGDAVRIYPCDRAWVGRPVLESRDRRDHVPAVNTWYYGYNSRIYETTKTEKTVVPNYSEQKLLWMVRWGRRVFGTDPARTYITGSSMGGSGTVSMIMHHPGVFAAAVANVPIVSYTNAGKGSLWRVECVFGPLDETAVTGDGKPLLEQMNGASMAAKATVDLPPLFLTHGRKDGSIPWHNNPPFYRAMAAARQAFTVFWNNGTHGMQKDAPDDVKAAATAMLSFRLDRSFPVFTNCSDDRDPGNGDPADGDLVGWINRGLTWKDLVDTEAEYALTVLADYPGIHWPVTVDVTPRRVQAFATKPGQTVKVTIGDGPPAPLTVDAQGLLTVRGVKVPDAAGTRLRITR